MNSYQEKTAKNKQISAANIGKSGQDIAAVFQFKDNRSEAIKQAKLKAKMEVNVPSTVPIQRKIHYKSGTYSSDSNRPGWRKFLKNYVVNEYNVKHATSYTSTNINLSTLHLDRCHRISFHDIQAWVIKYLNGNMSKAVFTERTDRLYDGSSTDKPLMVAERTRLFKARTKAKKLSSSRALLSLLNSATGNVSLGNDSINRSIGMQLDVNFKTNGSKQALTPNSRRMLSKMPKKSTSGIALTPGRTSVKSSHVGASVSISNTTPKTKRLIKKHIY